MAIEQRGERLTPEGGLFGITPGAVFEAVIDWAQRFGVKSEPPHFFRGIVTGFTKSSGGQIMVETVEETPGATGTRNNQYSIESFMNGNCGAVEIKYDPLPSDQGEILSGFLRIDRRAKILRRNRRF